MNIKGVQYQFTAKLWLHAPTGSWHFVSLPIAFSKEIRSMFKSEEEGWGRLKATAKVGESEWKTAIWYDSKQQTYLLPIKTEIRKKEKIVIDDIVEVIVWI